MEAKQRIRSALCGFGVMVAAACVVHATPPTELDVEVVRCYQSPKKIVITSETKIYKLALTPEQKKKHAKKGKIVPKRAVALRPITIVTTTSPSEKSPKPNLKKQKQ